MSKPASTFPHDGEIDLRDGVEVRPDARLEIEIFPEPETPPVKSIWADTLELVPGVVVACAATFFVLVITAFNWTKLTHGQQFGFDAGIFSQGTWLLAHLQAPFVTLRGLDLFGDHVSFILILVAPLYRLWPDPRLLLLLQAVALAVPAIVLFSIASKRAGQTVAMVFALAYLAYPAMQWAAVFQFHPETLAAAFLSLAALDSLGKSHKRMLVWLVLAALCKEDVSLLIIGFSALLWTQGKRKWAYWIAGVAVAYFLVVTQLVVPGINGRHSLYFQQNYGIGDGVMGIVTALPHLVASAFKFAVSEKGLTYLGLLLGPVVMLPLLRIRWMFPAFIPLFLNMASKIPYQQSIEYQYLATSSVFIVLAAFFGYMELRDRKHDYRFGKQIPLVLLVVFAVSLSWAHGPGKQIRSAEETKVAVPAAVTQAYAAIPDNAIITAGYQFDTELSGRKRIYEYPNPFVGQNWGIAGDKPSKARADSVEYIIVDQRSMGATDKAILKKIRATNNWTPVYEETPTGIIVLHRNGAAH